MFNATMKGNGWIDQFTGKIATPIDPANIAGVKVLWELVEYGRVIKYSGSSYDIRYDRGYVYFSTPDDFKEGAAYVAVYDSSGEILWSWLIWATPAPGDTKYDDILRIMDHNLGALTSSDATYKAGFLYQWGRKDPFPAGTSYNTTLYVYAPSISEAFKQENNDEHFTMAYATAHPTTHLGPAGVNWIVENEFKTYLWLYFENQKTIYAPCPFEWRIPYKDELGKIFKAGLEMPGGALPGDRFFDGYHNGGSQYYWSSTAESWTDAWSWSKGGLFTANGNSYSDWRLSSAMSIRPVRDRNPR